jgi:hydrogenase expression/formation protein HypD
VKIQYARAVTRSGNLLALRYIKEVFRPIDTRWRGMGIIHASGLGMRPEFRQFDAVERMPLDIKPATDNELCICGDILRGLKVPPECPLFGSACSPENPVGACMVSGEGSCNTYYKYHSGD